GSSQRLSHVLHSPCAPHPVGYAQFSLEAQSESCTQDFLPLHAGTNRRAMLATTASGRKRMQHPILGTKIQTRRSSYVHYARHPSDRRTAEKVADRNVAAYLS